MLGSVAIVAGTAIGAGMLALPLATAALGIIPALVLLVVIWGVSAYTSLLMLEINLRTGVGDNLHVITGKLLGKKGQIIQGASFLSLLFALTAAYLTGGSSLLVLKAKNMFDIVLDNQAAVLLFTLVLGGFAALGVAWVDKVSRFLFSLMILLLVVVVLFLLPEVSIASMATGAIAESMTSSWMAAIPVVFTSFGFHVCIATLVRYLDGDAVSLRKVLLIGSTIPLVCYVLWLLVTLGTVGGYDINGFEGSLPMLITALQEIAHTPWISKCISLFADLALVTSFLGVTLSLYDFVAELTRAKETFVGRIQTWLLTFVPPVLCALYLPEGFVAVLGFAAVPLVVMIIFLPIVMALRQRQLQLGGYQVSGGMGALALAGLLGAVIIGAQLFVAI
ncbi:amino acid permease [Shewanella glacialipiscicola]|uniref:aromatic amino acid transport family protein n=1 Tax=Shewanella glacialipiscicola TaxID=614069 RepID=UPI0021DB48E0|nr:aromatic amino acid transport family protein [Shewanella glacialipiscicola]MCU7996092.1 amino acid permease [Shewanella glacialipiscicola]MCU8027345.1 amino acid permease [Shewanella glacialipiscicola]